MLYRSLSLAAVLFPNWLVMMKLLQQQNTHDVKLHSSNQSRRGPGWLNKLGSWIT